MKNWDKWTLPPPPPPTPFISIGLSILHYSTNNCSIQVNYIIHTTTQTLVILATFFDVIWRKIYLRVCINIYIVKENRYYTLYSISTYIVLNLLNQINSKSNIYELRLFSQCLAIYVFLKEMTFHFVQMNFDLYFHRYIQVYSKQALILYVQ